MTDVDTSQPASEVPNHQPQPKRHAGGAPLLPPAIAYVVLAVAGIIAPPVVAGESPYSSDANLLDFYAHHAGAAHLLAFWYWPRPCRSAWSPRSPLIGSASPDWTCPAG